MPEAPRNSSPEPTLGGTAPELASTEPARNRAFDPDTMVTASAAAAVVPGFSRLQLGSELGRGGLGVVYAGADPVLRRELAVKMLQRSGKADTVARFIEEAQITGQLEHPNIVPVHEFGFDAEGRPYLTMKRVRGRDFWRVLRSTHRNLKETPAALTSPRVLHEQLRPLLDILEKVCDAVAFAHSRRVVHRDLKPENVMVGDYGEVLVVDWGLAKPLDADGLAKDSLPPDGRYADPDASTDDEPEPVLTTDRREIGALTAQGTVMGTPAYMSPEQALGRPVTEATDIYALGAILYTILCGRPPFEGEVPQVLDAVASGDFEPPSARVDSRLVPRELEAIALQAMAHDKRDRYPTADALKADMVAWRSGYTIAAADYSTLQLLRKWAARHKAAVGTALAAAVVLIATVATFMISLDAERDDAIRERNEAQQQRNEAQQQRERADREADDARVAREATQREAEAAQMARDRAEASLEVALAYMAGDRLDEGDVLGAITMLSESNHAQARATRLLVPPPVITAHALLSGHEGEVRAVAFRADGERLATAGQGPGLRVWNTATGAVTADLLTGHAGDTTITGVAFLPGGGTVTAALDSLIEVRDTDGRLRSSTSLHVPVTAIAVSEAGEIAFGLATGVMGTWQPGEAPVLFRSPNGPLGRVTALGFVPKTDLLAAATFSGTLMTINVRSHAIVHRHAAHDGPVTSMAINPNGRYILTAGHDSMVVVTRTSSFESDSRPVDRSGRSTSMSVSPDLRLGAIASLDGTVHIVDVKDDDLPLLTSLSHHSDCVWSTAFDPTGRFLATGSADGTVRLWRVTPPGRDGILACRRDIRQLAFSPNGYAVAALLEDQTVNVFGLGSPRAPTVIGDDPRHDSITAIVFRPDGGLVCGRDDGSVVVHRPDREPLPVSLGPHEVTALAVSPDGAWTAVGDERGGVWMLRGASLTPGPRDTLGHAVTALAFSGDGRWLAVGLATRTVRLIAVGDFTPRSWKPSPSRGDEDDEITSLAFDPASRMLWAADDDGALHVFDVTLMREVDEIRAHFDAIQALSISPDGQWLVTGSERDEMVRLWSLDSRTKVAEVMHDHISGPVAISPDGRAMAIAYRRDIRLTGGVVPGDAVDATRLTGLERNGFELRAPTTPPAPSRDAVAGWQQTDPGAAAFWRVFWECAHRIDRGGDPADDGLSAPIRAWLKANAGHPLAELGHEVVRAMREESGVRAHPALALRRYWR